MQRGWNTVVRMAHFLLIRPHHYCKSNWEHNYTIIPTDFPSVLETWWCTPLLHLILPSSLSDRGEWVEVSAVMLRCKLVFQQMVLLSISLLCNRWRRQQDTDVTNRTKPGHGFPWSLSWCDWSRIIYWVVHLQHSGEWLGGNQPLPASSSAQGMQSYPDTDLTRYGTAPQIVRCLFLGWVQWFCALVFN